MSLSLSLQVNLLATKTMPKTSISLFVTIPAVAWYIAVLYVLNRSYHSTGIAVTGMKEPRNSRK